MCQEKKVVSNEGYKFKSNIYIFLFVLANIKAFPRFDLKEITFGKKLFSWEANQKTWKLFS